MTYIPIGEAHSLLNAADPTALARLRQAKLIAIDLPYRLAGYCQVSLSKTSSALILLHFRREASTLSFAFIRTRCYH